MMYEYLRTNLSKERPHVQGDTGTLSGYCVQSLLQLFGVPHISPPSHFTALLQPGCGAQH